MTAHVRQAMELVNGNDDDIDVDLTEEDMNDESLLKELSELEEENKGPPLERLKARYAEETQRCLMFKRANKLDEAKKLLPIIRDLQSQIAELEKEKQGMHGDDDDVADVVEVPTVPRTAPPPRTVTPIQPQQSPQLAQQPQVAQPRPPVQTQPRPQVQQPQQPVTPKVMPAPKPQPPGPEEVVRTMKTNNPLCLLPFVK